MKYLILAYYDEATFDTLTPEKMQALRPECAPHDEALRKTGQLTMIASLDHRTRKTVRTRGGKMSVTDGPFVEAKEQVGSFFIIEAKDFDEAVRVASLHPAARIGEALGWGIEVRPIEYFVASDA